MAPVSKEEEETHSVENYRPAHPNWQWFEIALLNIFLATIEEKSSSYEFLKSYSQF